MTDRIDIAELRRIAATAQAASPGPYACEWTDEPGSGIDFIRDSLGNEVVRADSGVYEPRGYVALHLAANDPATVLGLLRYVAELELVAEAAAVAMRLLGEHDDADRVMAVLEKGPTR